MRQIHSRYQVLKSIYQINARMSFLHKLQGVDISRCFEYSEAYLRIAPVAGKRILDVGSYRSPFPAFLIRRGGLVSILDMDAAVAQQQEWIRRATGEEGRALIVLADGTRLPYLSNSFDRVVCISTIEHLPDDGDIRMIREIGRVLRMGGCIFITVPYAPVAREGRWGKWFQRWYDISGAFSRLADSAGLTVLAHGLLIGGIAGKIADIWYALPRIVRHSLSWTHVLLFPILFEQDTADRHDARVLWLLLGK